MRDIDHHPPNPNYTRRAKEVVPTSGPIAELVADLGIGARLNDDAFWARREREMAEAAKADAEHAARVRLGARANLLRESGFPLIHVEAALAVETMTCSVRAGRPRVETEALRLAAAFARDRRTSLDLAGGVGLRSMIVFAGGVGCGKSAAATWLALVSTDSSPQFVRAMQLERRGRYQDGLEKLMRESTSLFIDDVGAEVLDSRGAFEALIGEVIDVFYGDRRLLVLTANMRKQRDTPKDEPQFRERYGERTFSRFRESAKWADCGSFDLRDDVAVARLAAEQAGAR
jgi:hypothetical protein